MKILKPVLAFAIFSLFSSVSLAAVHTTKYLIFVENVILFPKSYLNKF